jgi:hypothetical protein
VELKFILLADTANQTIFAQQFPAVWPALTMVARLEAHPGQGLDHTAQLKVVNEDGKEIVVSPLIPIKFVSASAGIPARADLLFGMAGLVIPARGDYAVMLFVDAVLRGQVTLYVREQPTTPHAGG